MVFCQTWGGGAAGGVKKPYCFFEKVFFQRACRIILGPPKHVLHLVCSVLGISTAIKIALKGALYDCFDGPLAPLNGQFMARVDHYNRTKQISYLIGPSVKFGLPIMHSISRKMGVKNIPQSRAQRVGWRGGVGVCV